MPSTSLSARTTKPTSASFPPPNARSALPAIDDGRALLSERPVPLHHLMFWLTSGAAAWVTIAVVVAWLVDLRLPLLP